jgi:hypothetical protein
MDLGQLSKNLLIILAATVLAMIGTVLINRKYDVYVLNRLDGLEHVVNMSIPQGRFSGLNIRSFDHLKGSRNFEYSKFIYNDQTSVGVNGLVPTCFSGLQISRISIPLNGGFLYLWYLDSTNEIVWDAYIHEGIQFSSQVFRTNK